MQTWARRGIQTALVTGGMLMLGTGIASADEDVNPDKPASPLDVEPNVASALNDATLRQPLSALQGITKDIPVVNQLVDQIAGSVAGTTPDSSALNDTAVHETIDNVLGVHGQDTASGGRSDQPTRPNIANRVVDWVAPLRVDSGSIALHDREVEAVGQAGPHHYGVLTDLRSVRELADLGQLPARLHQAGGDLIATGDSLGEELVDVSGGLVEASQNQTQGLDGGGLVSGDLAVVPADQTLPAIEQTAHETAAAATNSAPASTVEQAPSASGSVSNNAAANNAAANNAVSNVVSRAPIGDLPVFDVPADVLTQALSTATEDLGITQNSTIHLPINRLEAVPNRLPSLLPLGRALLRDHVPATPDPVDEVVGVFSGVLQNATNATDQLAGEVTSSTSVTDTVESPRIVPSVAPGLTNPFGPITGDLFDGDTLTIAGELVNRLTSGAGTGDLSALLPVSPPASGARGDLRGDLPVDLPADLPAVLPATVSTNLPANLNHDIPGLVHNATNDLDVTQIVPPIPSLSDLRGPSLRAVPAMASFPSVDPGTLTDTRAALASLFTNRPIG